MSWQGDRGIALRRTYRYVAQANPKIDTAMAEKNRFLINVAIHHHAHHDENRARHGSKSSHSDLHTHTDRGIAWIIIPV